jgi:hypothetical protein
MLRAETGYTGKIIEREILGKIEKERSKERPDVFENLEKTYLPYKKAMEAVKRMQPFDPSDPEPGFANDLHATIAERLKLEDYSRLRFFTAISSHLDIWHGVDAFFELDSKEKKIIVTLDVTSNPNKDSCKADVLVEIPSEGLDPKEDRIEYMEKIEEVADKVVSLIKSNSSRGD